MFPLRFYRNKRSSILIVCLWALIILSILGMGLAGLVFQEIKFAKAYRRASLSLPVARAAVRAVFLLRMQDPSPNFDTFDEMARENSQSLCAGNSFKYYLADKRTVSGKTELIDEGALINLNTVSMEILKRLPGMDEELAEKIVTSGLRPFKSINEVFLVEGMDKEKFLLFKDLVTVHGSGKININTASRGVLLALGLDSDTIDEILSFREEHKIEDPNLGAGEDPGYGFSDAGKILDDLREYSSLSLTQEENILSLLPFLDVKSEYLRLNVIPVYAGQEGMHYSIVINPVKKEILSWNEY